MLFAQIDYVEFECHIFRGIFDTEEKPLVVASGIDVILEDEVIFIIFSLVDSEKIPRLEIGVKLDPTAMGDLRGFTPEAILLFEFVVGA